MNVRHRPSLFRRNVYVLVGVALFIGIGILAVSGARIFSKFTHQGVLSRVSPYPPSPVIEEVTWDFDSLYREAQGSDLFPLTWADDDNPYTAWGDGNGFKNSPQAYLGVSKVSGSPPST